MRPNEQEMNILKVKNNMYINAIYTNLKISYLDIGD